jgi:hypothetical protein
LGEGIRRRLQVSFEADPRPRDQMTNLLLDLIKRIALNLSLDEEWWANPFAADVFKTAISELVQETASFVGGGRLSEPGAKTKFQIRYGPDEKPETIGRILTRTAFVENAQEVLTWRAQQSG